jgi:hypothetical protein
VRLFYQPKVTTKFLVYKCFRKIGRGKSINWIWECAAIHIWLSPYQKNGHVIQWGNDEKSLIAEWEFNRWSITLCHHNLWRPWTRFALKLEIQPEGFLLFNQVENVFGTVIFN